MKKLGHEEINGRLFSVYQVEELETLRDMYGGAESHAGRKLSDVYGKYSATKARIFDDWKHWADSNDNVREFGIASRNAYVFTLSFVYTGSVFGRSWYAVGRISKGSNRLYVW